MVSTVRMCMRVPQMTLNPAGPLTFVICKLLILS